MASEGPTLLTMLFHAEDTNMKQFKEELVALAKQVKRVVDEIEAGFTSVVKTILNLPALDSNLKAEKRQCNGKVSKAKRSAHAFLECVYGFYEDTDLDSDAAHSMIESFRKGDAKSMFEHMEKMKTSFERCRESYTEFIGAYAEAKVMCAKIAECYKAKRDKGNEQVAISGGGTGTGAADVALSVAIARIALGEGTVAVTSADALSMVGGVPCLTTLADAAKDAHLEAVFESICTDMDTACEDLSNISIHLESISEKLQVTERDLTDSLSHVREEQAFQNFGRMFDILVSGIGTGYDEFH